MIPSETLRPSALALTVKLDFGSWPEPRVWNGPPKLRVTGPLSVLDPDGSRVRVRLSTPLVTLCVPVKVCLSSAFGSPELLLALPHAATPSPASTTTITVLNIGVSPRILKRLHDPRRRM